MAYKKIAQWTKGYVDSLIKTDKVQKAELDLLIKRLSELIMYEEQKFLNENKSKTDDDLPF